MTNTLCVQIQRSPDRFRRRCFSCMRRQPQSVLFRVGIHTAKQLWRCFDLVTANTDTHHVPVFILHGKFEYFLCLFHSEMAGGIEDPKQRDSKIASPSCATTL